MNAQPAGQPMARPLSPRPNLSTFAITRAWTFARQGSDFGSIILKFKRRLTKLSFLNKPRRPPCALSMMHSLPFRSPTRDRISASTEGERTDDSWVDRAILAQSGMDGHSKYF